MDGTLDSAPTSPQESGSPAGPASVKAAGDAICESVGKVMVGKREAIQLLLVALLSEGHVLLEDVPGVGKTVLARAFARSLNVSFGRIQGTPDLLPSDVTGVSYYHQQSGEFVFRQGPIFAGVVLADEINRATPRTQAALLEAMQERQVTVDGQTLPLPKPFLLLATQNPVELEGTFPLPEAQLDRFLIRLRMLYPSLDEERAVLFRFKEADPLASLQPVLGEGDLTRLVPIVRGLRVSRPIADYILAIVRQTREHPAVELGGSPRASLALFRAAQAHAAMQGRAYVLPDDVKALVGPVLAHRMIITAQGRLRGQDAGQILDAIVAQTPVPVEDLPATRR